MSLSNPRRGSPDDPSAAAGGPLHPDAGRADVSRAEASLAGLFAASWIAVLANLLGLLPLAGGLDLSLYAYYSLAATAGWLAGNVYVHRRRGKPRTLRRRLLMLYLCGPPSLVELAGAVAPAVRQQAAPLAPVWACGVYAALFLVPVVFPPRPRRGPE